MTTANEMGKKSVEARRKKLGEQGFKDSMRKASLAAVEARKQKKLV